MRLQDELKKRGLSQRELAYRAGVSATLLNSYCRGARPSQRNAIRIAQALNMDPTQVWGPAFETFRKER